MKIICVVVYYAFLFLPIAAWSLDNADYLQEHYKKVADGLISIRKEYPPIQPKVYAMLDQLDKLYNSAKTSDQINAELTRRLKEKTAENVTLKNELFSLRNEVSTTKKTLASAKTELDQKLLEEKNKNELLAQEHKDLLTKISTLEMQKKKSRLAKKSPPPNQSKQDLVAMANTDNKLVTEHQPNLSRISTSEPNSPH